MMSSHNRRFIPLAALALAMAGVAIAAPQAANDAKTAKAAAAHPGHHGAMLKLDTNNDGSIDRAEAAAHPRMAAAFAKFDKNADGRIDASERPTRHEGQGRHGGKGAHRRGGHGGMSHAIRLDTDGDGRISTVEAKDSPLAERFASIDRNRDGFLVRAEIQAYGEQRRAEHKAQRMQRFEARFAAADGNRDGKLSRAEVEASMPRHAKAFAFMDGDRDGFLTRAELQPAPRR